MLTILEVVSSVIDSGRRNCGCMTSLPTTTSTTCCPSTCAHCSLQPTGCSSTQDTECNSIWKILGPSCSRYHCALGGLLNDKDIVYNWQHKGAMRRQPCPGVCPQLLSLSRSCSKATVLCANTASKCIKQLLHHYTRGVRLLAQCSDGFVHAMPGCSMHAHCLRHWQCTYTALWTYTLCIGNMSQAHANDIGAGCSSGMQQQQQWR